jgi:nucleolar MIF4G domain-containing protein 1
VQAAKAWRKLRKEFVEDGFGEDFVDFLQEVEMVGKRDVFREEGPSSKPAEAGSGEEDDEDDDSFDSEYGADWRERASALAGKADRASRVRDLYGQDVPASAALQSKVVREGENWTEDAEGWITAGPGGVDPTEVFRSLNSQGTPLDDGDDEEEEDDEDEDEEEEEEEEEDEEEEEEEAEEEEEEEAAEEEEEEEEEEAEEEAAEEEEEEEEEEAEEEAAEEDEDDHDEGLEEEGEADDSDEEAPAKRMKPASGAKYLPPSMRRAAAQSGDEEEVALRRQIKGLLNRLGENNVEPVTKQVEAVLASHSTGVGGRALATELAAACAASSTVVKSLVAAAGAMVGALHATVSESLGAAVAERIVTRIEEVVSSGDEAAEGELANLATLLAYLYLFHVVHPSLIADGLKRMLDRLSGGDVEMLLVMVRLCGFQLRGDDPASLRDVIAAATERAGTGEGLSPRAKVMLELLADVKNNRRRQSEEQLRERATVLRKWLASLVKRRKRDATDRRLRVSWQDLIDADVKGRWWLVGASWAGNMASASESATTTLGNRASSKEALSGRQAVLYEEAAKHGFVTDTRRRVFVALMGATNVDEALESLFRMNLKGPAEREIVRVLLECACRGKHYNPFFAVVGARFCSTQPSAKFTFQLALWDLLKSLEDSKPRRVYNLARITADLMLRFTLSLAALKAFDITKPTELTMLFLRVCLGSILEHARSDEELVAVFSRLGGGEDKTLVKDSISFFLSNYMGAHIIALCPQDDEDSRKRRSQLHRRLKLARSVIDGRGHS